MNKTGFFEEFLKYESKAEKEPLITYVLHYYEDPDQEPPSKSIGRIVTGKQFTALSEHMKRTAESGYLDRDPRVKHYLVQYEREVKRLSSTAAAKSGLLEEIKAQPELKPDLKY